MAYRNSEFSELCGECRIPAHDRCSRCAVPMCNAHGNLGASIGDTRCFACELGYLAREARVVRLFVTTLVLAGALVGVLGALTVHAARNGFIASPVAEFSTLPIVVGIAFMAGAFMIPGLVSRILRARFLGEHSGRGPFLREAP